jgi:hypothetical protein
VNTRFPAYIAKSENNRPRALSEKEGNNANLTDTLNEAAEAPRILCLARDIS